MPQARRTFLYVEICYSRTDHGHTFDHVKGLLPPAPNSLCHYPKTSVPAIREMFEKSYPDAPQIDRAVAGRSSIDVICIAAIPADRADLAIRAMKSGKDVMTGTSPA